MNVRAIPWSTISHPLRNRKLRGVLGIGLVWAILWAVILVLLFAVARLVPGGKGPIDVWPTGPLVGFVSGLAFGALLAWAERGKSVPSIALDRAALWGALASVMFPLLTWHVQSALVACPIGALLAMASLGLAQRTVIRGAEPTAVDFLRHHAHALIRDAVSPSRPAYGNGAFMSARTSAADSARS